MCFMCAKFVNLLSYSYDSKFVNLLSLGLFSVSGGGRYLSTDSNKIDEPFNVEEVDSVHVPPTPTEKLLVRGGNGFVGSHICKEALDRGLSVSSLSR
ncbi:hypothetical protein ARALYDRAFT_916279 [Arabidopsis lyrata subsp. lyrata]|uniref:NAD-dependent epimerase/dehydratase domain-containing protein n=1 Tax=Arabidopsis lyrata subsp. lyrata TaxID=81972 RepID=D7MJE4_ARALL|nr:hypothetical protein ARALYDRAFT_916279 [Arabidopsis lyrata subsp. lyrata]